MTNRLKQSRLAWLAWGLIVGLGVGVFFPSRTMQAVATDSQSDFTIATGLIDDNTEAVFLLDHLTGDLTATIVNPQTGQLFFNNFTFKTNVRTDLSLQAGKAPKFVMVTGMADLRGGGQLTMGQSVVYIVETTSGNMVAYALPYSVSGAAPPQFKKLFAGPVRAAVRAP